MDYRAIPCLYKIFTIRIQNLKFSMESNKKDLTVSIVTYSNDHKELCEAVDSVLKSDDINLKLYIVDNSPTDELRSMFKDRRIEYIFNNANIGFGAAHNIALRKAIQESPYHLCLNPDVHFGPTVLKNIKAYMDSHPTVGQLLPRIVDSKGEMARKQRHLLPSPFITFFRGLLKGLPITKKLTEEYFTRFKSYDEEMPAPFLAGSFVFLRTAVIQEVGMFDERFFMYYEDADLSRRIYSHTGNMYWPGVTVSHVGHMDSHKNWKLTRIHIQSAIRYYNKWGWFEKTRKQINDDLVARYTHNE